MDNHMLINELQDYIEHQQLLFLDAESTMSTQAISEDATILLKTQSSLSNDINNYNHNPKETSFIHVLFNFIDTKHIDEKLISTKLNIHHHHFIKLRSGMDFHPTKPTVLGLCFVLALNKEETGILLKAAGYTFDLSHTFDLAIMFCLEHKIYKLDEVNHLLDYLSIAPL